jgi:hypothetical protein
MKTVIYASCAALLLSGCSVGDSPAASALSCNSPAAKTAASSKLAEWIDQNVVKGSVSAPLVVDMIAVSPWEDSGTRCRVVFSIAFREASGNLFGGFDPNSFATEFLLVGSPNDPQITLDDGDMRASVINEASAITGFEREREHR